MKRFFGPLIAALLLTLVAHADTTTTKNISIVVTGTSTGAQITTMTIQNGDPSNAIVPGATGYPVIMGQAFTRSNNNGIASTGLNQYPSCVDPANNNAPLVCQWDDIATHRENGDDGTWRHATLTVLLPASSPQYTSGGLAACTASPCAGTFQIKFVETAGAYTPASHGSINDICNGHDIKLVMTDVRNQDDSLRGPSGFTGTLTFDTCAAINNTGRDAPRQFAQGAVRNGWLVQGPPLYSNGAADPLLYVKCYMSQTYTLLGTLGPLQHMCSVHNSWMNVAAGSAGNAGAPGPAGFTTSNGGGNGTAGHQDPQAVSYRPVLQDGSTTILDWGTTYFDESVADTALNVAEGMWVIPALATGGNSNNKSWGRGNAFRYSDSATPPSATQNGGVVFQQNQLVYTCADFLIHCGTTDSNYVPTDMTFSKYPWMESGGVEAQPIYTAQGTGTSTFSWRIQHFKWTAWWTVDVSGCENWSPASSATRYVSLISPQYTEAEKTYWKETGTIAALKTQSAANFPNYLNRHDGQYNTRYAPMDLVNFQLGTGVGGRPDIGLHNEFFSEAWSAQTPAYWQLARSSALVGMIQPQGDFLNEATARVAALNNGRPGANGAGNGTGYTGLGALFSPVYMYWTTAWPSVNGGITPPLENVPYNDCLQLSCSSGWADAFYYGNQDNSHQSSYAFGPYQLFGGEMYLEALQAAAERAIDNDDLFACIYNNSSGNAQQCTLNGITYYSKLAPGDERRGSAWSMRDVGAAAAYGSDNLIERTYFNDVLNETFAYNKACGLPCGMVDPPTPNSGTIAAAQEFVGGPYYSYFQAILDPTATFISSYVTLAMYVDWGTLHYPLAKDYLSMMYRYFAAVCGDTIVPNSPSSMFCATSYDTPVTVTINPSSTYGVANVTDATDWGYNGGVNNAETFTAGSSIIQDNIPTQYITQTWPTKVKFLDYSAVPTPPGFSSFSSSFSCSALPDQITEGRWYYLINNTATPGQFQISATPGGSAIGPFTKGGSNFSGTTCFAEYRWDTGTAGTGPTQGQMFNQPTYGMDSIVSITAIADANASLGGILTSAPALLTNVNNRLSDNTQGWTYLNAVSADRVANDFWDSSVAVQ